MVGERESGIPRIAYFVFPASQARIEPTRHTTGMSGTGSNTAVAEGIRVPASRMIRLEDLVTVRQHKNNNFELYGRVLLGGEPMTLLL